MEQCEIVSVANPMKFLCSTNFAKESFIWKRSFFLKGVSLNYLGSTFCVYFSYNDYKRKVEKSPKLFFECVTCENKDIYRSNLFLAHHIVFLFSK